MRFSFTTIAAAALFLSASAAPAPAPQHMRGHRSNGRGGSGGNNGTKVAGSSLFPRSGGAAPTGGFSGSNTQPSGTHMTTVPSVLPGADNDAGSMSLELPSSKRQIFDWFLKREDSEKDASDSSDSKNDKEDKSSDASDSTDSADDSAEDSSGSPSSGSGTNSTSSSGSSSSGSSSSGSSSSGSSNSTTPSSGSSSSSSTFPAAAGESTLSQTMSVTGEFDGGMVRFGRGVSCTGQAEGGDSDAVFSIEDGGTLKNVIIGADQIEGVHCQGACTIENVWWEAVCEDALTFKKDGAGTVTGGGAKAATDKVIQQNGLGTVTIKGFSVTDFGKLYRSCGNCKTMGERHVVIDGVNAQGGTATFVGINSNYGDTATITNSCVKAKNICEEFEGNDTGAEPKEISTGPSSACIYTDADINAC